MPTVDQCIVSHLTPFYLREHSKRILRSALFNDSKFLADVNVMDYSLVVGVDSKHQELVVGIVGACHAFATDVEQWLTFKQTTNARTRGTRSSKAGSRTPRS
jgi:hypothetical protein